MTATQAPRSTSAWGRLREFAAVIRLRPFDVSTAQGRSRERFRRAALSTVGNAVARGTTVITAIITVPLTINYLGPERYGMWMTISAAFAFAVVADLGIANGLLNMITSAHAADDRRGARRQVSNAWFVLLISATVLSLALAGLYPIVNWSALFNVRSDLAVAEAGLGVAAFGVTWIVTLLNAAAGRVNDGYQEGYVNSFWQALGSLLSLGAVVLGVYLEVGLPLLILGFTGGPAITGLCNTAAVFFFRRPWLRPRRDDIDSAVIKGLLSSGVWFVTLAVGYHIVVNVSNLVIAHFISADAVAEFAIPMRAFAVLNMTIMLALSPLWPAYGESLARGDVAWAAKTLRRSLQLSALLMSGPSIALVVFGQALIRWWVGDVIHPSIAMLAGLACWYFLMGVGNALHTFLLGGNAVRFQGRIRMVQALVVVPLQMVCIRHWGLAGVAWALATAELFCRFIPAAIMAPRVLRAHGKKPTLSAVALHQGDERDTH